MAEVRAAFSLVPEYLRTLDRSAPVRDVSEYTPQLGRRFRALKLWVLLRWFGLAGLRRRIAHHVAQAQELVAADGVLVAFDALEDVLLVVLLVRVRGSPALLSPAQLGGAQHAASARRGRGVTGSVANGVGGSGYRTHAKS